MLVAGGFGNDISISPLTSIYILAEFLVFANVRYTFLHNFVYMKCFLMEGFSLYERIKKSVFLLGAGSNSVVKTLVYQ